MALRRLELETELRTPWLGRSPRERNGYPLQYSCLENPVDRGAWQVTVRRVTKSWTRLSMPVCMKLIDAIKYDGKSSVS